MECHITKKKNSKNSNYRLNSIMNFNNELFLNIRIDGFSFYYFFLK